VLQPWGSWQLALDCLQWQHTGGVWERLGRFAYSCNSSLHTACPDSATVAVGGGGMDWAWLQPWD
jgi:hypothetical protein